MNDKTHELTKTEPAVPANAAETTQAGDSQVRTFRPAVDIRQTDDAVGLLADLPGVDENAVDVQLDKNVLTIRAEVEHPEFEGYELVHQEFEVGNFERAFRISERIDTDNIDATVKDGVLQLKLPKVQLASRQVTVKRSE